MVIASFLFLLGAPRLPMYIDEALLSSLRRDTPDVTGAFLSNSKLLLLAPLLTEGSVLAPLSDARRLLPTNVDDALFSSLRRDPLEATVEAFLSDSKLLLAPIWTIGSASAPFIDVRRLLLPMYIDDDRLTSPRRDPREVAFETFVLDSKLPLAPILADELAFFAEESLEF